ncbi:MAG TPA: hypothetical protein VL359_20665, partial [bacterium]|nr:hypothetical protein [bacterium]
MARRRFFDDEESYSVSGRTLTRLLSYLGPHKGTVALAIGIVLFTAVAAQVGPYLMKVAVDVYVPAGNLRGVIALAVALAAVLHAEVLRVQAALPKKLRVATALHDLPVVHDENLVRVQH